MNKSSFDRSNKKKNWVYEIKNQGHNYRMTEMNAAVGISQLKRLKKIISRRNLLVKTYKKFLINSKLRFQKINKGTVPSVLYFVIILKTKKIRDNLSYYLKNHKIQTSVHWDPPLSKHKIFNKFTVKKNFKNSENLSSRILTLPLYPQLSLKDVIDISKKIQRYLYAK